MTNEIEACSQGKDLKYQYDHKPSDIVEDLDNDIVKWGNCINDLEEVREFEGDSQCANDHGISCNLNFQFDILIRIDLTTHWTIVLHIVKPIYLDV